MYTVISKITKLLGKAFFILAAFASLSIRAHAGGSETSEFARMMREGQSLDGQVSKFSSRIVFERGTGVSEIDARGLSELSRIAAEQAQIWADTILEGDYEAAGDTQLDRVEGLYSDGRLVAYRITYSEKAWFTGECDPETDLAKLSCDAGRISEATYVAPDYNEYTIDRSAYADFVSGKL